MSKRTAAAPKPATAPPAEVAPAPAPTPGGLLWTTERRRISDLVEWEKNPRQLTEKQAEDLAASLRRFGYVEPIAVNTDGQIIGGHMRRRILLAQAMLDPHAEVDVRIPSRQLTSEEVEELAIRLNKNSGEWDWERLANEFDLSELMEWGFSEADLGAFGIAGAQAAALDDEDRQPYQEMTFKLHDSQAETVKAAIAKAKREGGVEESENENSNGNALALICRRFLDG